MRPDSCHAKGIVCSFIDRASVRSPLTLSPINQLYQLKKDMAGGKSDAGLHFSFLCGTVEADNKGVRT
jgi:hypothetical protein